MPVTITEIQTALNAVPFVPFIVATPGDSYLIFDAVANIRIAGDSISFASYDMTRAADPAAVTVKRVHFFNRPPIIGPNGDAKTFQTLVHQAELYERIVLLDPMAADLLRLLNARPFFPFIVHYVDGQGGDQAPLILDPEICQVDFLFGVPPEPRLWPGLGDDTGKFADAIRSLPLSQIDSLEETGGGGGGGPPPVETDPLAVHRAGTNAQRTMTAPLFLSGLPTLNPHAASKEYVDSLLTGPTPTLVGTINGTTGDCVFTTESGLTNGPLPDPAAANRGFYVLAIIAGQGLVVGDWVISDGTAWILIAVGGQGGLNEAPIDGEMYGRQDARWEIVPPGIPRGGAATMILSKLDATDFNTAWVGPPIGVPAGGTIDQVLGKTAIGNYQIGWRSSGVPRGGTTGQVLAKSGIGDFTTEWIPPAAGGGVEEAPPGALYGRQDGAWEIVPPNLVPIGPLPPATPEPGQLWWRNDPDGNLFIRYDDGTTVQWVPASPAGAGGGLPPGGAIDQVLGKIDATDSNANWRPSGVPRGGATGEVLAKSAVADFATEWIPPVATPPFDDTHLLALDGSRPMTGVLELAPIDAVGPNDAVRRRYVDTLVTGSPILIGAINGTTGDCQYSTASGFTNGPLIAANLTQPGYHVICFEGGTIPGGPANGVSMIPGDWLISDGVAWLLIQLGNPGGAVAASQVALLPNVAGADNVQTGMQNLQAQKIADGGPLTQRMRWNIPAGASFQYRGIDFWGNGGANFAGVLDFGFDTAQNMSAFRVQVLAGGQGVQYPFRTTTGGNAGVYVEYDCSARSFTQRTIAADAERIGRRAGEEVKLMDLIGELFDRVKLLESQLEAR